MQDKGAESGPRVAIVDDDRAALESFGALLDSAGYTTCLFESCEAFLLASSDLQGACLLLDARFIGMSGTDLLAQLERSGARIPTVFVMGRFDSATRARALRYPSVIRVLDKPVSTSDLLEAVRLAAGG